jgi:hypothetical protein
MSKTRTIKVDYLARVEGEGGMWIKLKENQVADVKLKIFEPPRFFEAFLRGRKFTEERARAPYCRERKRCRVPRCRRRRASRRVFEAASTTT